MQERIMLARNWAMWIISELPVIQDLASLVRDLERAQARRREWERYVAEASDVCPSDAQVETDTAKQSQNIHADTTNEQATEIQPPDQAEVDAGDAAMLRYEFESSQQSASAASDMEQIHRESAKQSQSESAAALTGHGESAPKKPSESVAAEDTEHRTGMGG